MTDRDFEDRLKRLRPVGPSSELRARIVGRARPAPQPVALTPRWILALPVIAAAAIVVFGVLASNSHARSALALHGDDEAAIETLGNQFGGDAIAMTEARRAVRLLEDQARDLQF